VQLQSARQRFEAQGLKLAAISHDSPASLNDFVPLGEIVQDRRTVVADRGQL